MRNPFSRFNSSPEIIRLAAMTVIGNAAARVRGRWLNNRAENSHQPFQRREGAMATFGDVKTL